MPPRSKNTPISQKTENLKKSVPKAPTPPVSDDESFDEDIEDSFEGDFEEDIEEDGIMYADEDFEEDFEGVDADEDIEEDVEEDGDVSDDDDNDVTPVRTSASVKPAATGKKSLADLLASADSFPKKKQIAQQDSDDDSDDDSDSEVEEVSVGSLKKAAAAKAEEERQAVLKAAEQRKALLRRRQEEAQEHSKKKKLDVEVDESDMLSPDVLEEAQIDEETKQEEILRKKNMGMLAKDALTGGKSKKLIVNEPVVKKRKVLDVNKPKVYQKDGFTIAVNPFKQDRRTQMIDMTHSFVSEKLLDRRDFVQVKRVDPLATIVRKEKPAAVFATVKRK